MIAVLFSNATALVPRKLSGLKSPGNAKGVQDGFVILPHVGQAGGTDILCLETDYHEQVKLSYGTIKSEVSGNCNVSYPESYFEQVG